MGTTKHVFISWILFRPYFLSRSIFTKIYLGKGCNVTLNQVLNSNVKIMANQLWPLWSRTLWDGHHLQVIIVYFDLRLYRQTNAIGFTEYKYVKKQIPQTENSINVTVVLFYLKCFHLRIKDEILFTFHGTWVDQWLEMYETWR